MDGMAWVRESWLDTLALTEDWMKSKEFEMIKQFESPLEVGVTVRIIGSEFTGQVGELVAIEPENDSAGDFFGIHLDSVGHEVFFRADEIERVENVDMAELPF